MESFFLREGGRSHVEYVQTVGLNSQAKDGPR